MILIHLRIFSDKYLKIAILLVCLMHLNIVCLLNIDNLNTFCGLIL